MPGRQVRSQTFPLAAQELISGAAAQAANPGARTANRGGSGESTD